MMRHAAMWFLLPAALVLGGCIHYDDFEFTGTVIDYEFCSSYTDYGYAIQLSSPDTIGGTYTTQNGDVFNNVVVLYQSPLLLKHNQHVSGRMFLDPKYSKTECNWHYDRDTPEGRITDVKVD